MLGYLRFRRLHFGYTLVASASCLQLESSSRSGLPLPSPPWGTVVMVPAYYRLVPSKRSLWRTYGFPFDLVMEPGILPPWSKIRVPPWTFHFWRSRLHATLQRTDSGGRFLFHTEAFCEGKILARLVPRSSCFFSRKYVLCFEWYLKNFDKYILLC
jgi:hypothetical protein